MFYNADFHIHSPFSMATSGAMTPSSLLKASSIKGIQILGCGDALHPEWRQRWEPFIENDQGIFVIPTVEIEGEKRVHHLIMMEDFEQFSELADLLRKNSNNMDKAGRPHVSLDGEAIAETVHDIGGLIGPAHAFTPWTGIYGHFNHISECYGLEPIDFLELGLSADSSYGERITNLYPVPFLSNSDAHSASPLKLGREFNRIQCSDLSVRSVLDCVRKGSIVMNAGFFPEEGKYNRTACTRCFQQYSLSDAENTAWKCPHCQGKIKMGVKDRAFMKSNGEARPRPPYYHIIPLGEIIQKTLCTSSPGTKKCMMLYDSLISQLGNEIEILVDVPVSDIRDINPPVSQAIDAFRKGNITLIPGGGGKYGSFSF